MNVVTSISSFAIECHRGCHQQGGEGSSKTGVNDDAGRINEWKS
jgi:hypothetical protein